MAWSLVCPANRGIGFHLTRHLLQTTKIPIVATTRRDVEGVKMEILDQIPEVDRDRLTVVKVDVTGMPPSQLLAPYSNTCRRVHYLPCSGMHQIPLPQLLPPPTSYVLHSRNPIPRKVSFPTESRTTYPNIRRQHHRAAPSNKTLLPLPTHKTALHSSRNGAPCSCSLDEHIGSSRLNVRQRTWGLV